MSAFLVKALPRELRGYQTEAVAAVRDAWATGTYRPAVVLPTGTGKSTVIAKLAVDARAAGLRVAMLAHRGELLGQMADSVLAVDPHGPRPGIVQAGLDESSGAIIAGSFQTLVNAERRARIGRRDIILVDEAHHAPAETYTAVLRDLGAFDPASGVLTAGFTATMSRSDGGLGGVWDEVVFERDIRWALEHGFLVRPRGLTVVLPGLDLSKIRTVAGDYAGGELAEAMAASVDSTVDAYIRHATGRATIVFAAGVDHADALAEALTFRGVRADAVLGHMSPDDREDVYRRFRDGELDAMVTVQVLTEGADFPRCDAVVLARPTKSQTLYAQMVGRALRQYPGKTDALVLDLAGSTRDTSLVTITNLDPEAKTRKVTPDGEEVLEEDLAEPAGGAPPRRFREGPLELETIDLLAASSANWLTTNGGVRFLDTQGHLVFLWPPHPPEAGPVSVGWTPSRGRRDVRWVSGPDGSPITGTLAQAVEGAELLAPTIGTIPYRDASWRSTAKPSDGQITFAAGLGIDNPEGKTRARLSDDISTALASRLLPVR